MENINIFELRRDIVHILVGILFILIVMFLPYAKVFLFIVLVIGCLISFLSTKFYIPLISECLELFERKENAKFPGKGVLFFFVGSLLSLQLFSKDIALASILILTFSDPLSHFIGSNFGRTILFNERKYIEGTFFGILVGTLFACFFVSPILAFAGAFVAMFMETAEVAMAGQTIDDNLLIPLVAGTIMHFIRLRFGIL